MSRSYCTLSHYARTAALYALNRSLALLHVCPDNDMRPLLIKVHSFVLELHSTRGFLGRIDEFGFLPYLYRRFRVLA